MLASHKLVLCYISLKKNKNKKNTCQLQLLLLPLQMQSIYSVVCQVFLTDLVYYTQDFNKINDMHLGWGSPGSMYVVGDKRQDSSTAERDLGVPLGSKLNMSQQYVLAAQRANHTLGSSSPALPAGREKGHGRASRFVTSRAQKWF